MLISIALACLLGPAAAYPIVQKDVLDELVTQSSLNVVSNPVIQQEHITVTAAILLGTGVPDVPAVPDVNVVPGDGQQIEGEQAAAHSSSESESSEQSQSVENPTEPPSENTSESTEEDSDPHTSEQVSESQDVTSEDTTSEETPSPLEIQHLEHTDSNGELRDDSQGSEECIHKSWLHAFRRNFHRQIHGGDIMGGVATDPPVTEVAIGTAAVGVTVGVAEAATIAVSNSPALAPAVSTPVPAAPATEAHVTETDSAASESKESQEEAELNEWNKCSELLENGDCVPHQPLSDDGKIEDDLHHGGLRLEEDLGHMAI
ncbi:SH3 domain-containing protein 21-like [Astyanax mexicanus]|uniref:SH3 domain-containing protein 21-like n=1 Tax=Astyanax mexicanus TaxID=7994 RepID=A0A8T2LCE8_ASTMX|nr:SH3 domain-containing protein 21-like [Astyanax mexicanus]